MRNISTASLAKLSQKTGTEPVCLVEVEWATGHSKLYGDKSIDAEGVEGRILSISSFDDVLNVSGSGTSQSVTVTLDDSDGQMKEFFNNVDFHRKKVTIYQWFTGIPLSDKFVLFAGVTATPVVWKESDRTLTFTVISKSSDIEVGFSPEEGQFSNLPQDQIGKTWPLVFGRVLKLPAIRIDDIPHKDKQGDAADSVTQDDHGIEDPSLEPHIKAQEDQSVYAAKLAQLYFISYLQASYTARKHGEVGELDDIGSGSGYFSSLAKQYLDQGNKYLLQSQKIKKAVDSKKTVLRKQKEYNRTSIPVTNGDLFKQGVVKRYKIGEGIYTGSFVGNSFNITEVQHPDFEEYEGLEHPAAEDEDAGQIYTPRTKFFWNPSGARLIAGIVMGDDDDDEPDNIRYIVASTLNVSVQAVYAMRDKNGITQLSVVPRNLYSVHNVLWGTLPTTMILVPHALSGLVNNKGDNEGWDDELYVSCTSPVGPNPVNIIIWLIQTYTGHAYDSESFDEVRTLLASYPANFAVLDRPNVISLIQEIAYQSRCIVWLKNNVFHIRYLSKKTPATAVISEADVIEQSLEVSYTETEDLVTKVKAAWRSDYKQSNLNLVILRYNIKYYGLHEVQKSYFIYNQQFLVEKSAVFWFIRDSSTFKRVKCRVPIKFLNIETLDTVTLNFSHNFIANTAIDCMVESAILDTGSYEIELTLWCPVRAGEMTEFPFAFPGSLTIQYFWPTEIDVSTGRAGSGSDVSFNNNVREPSTGSPAFDKPMTADPGNGGQLHITRRPHTWGVDPEFFADETNAAPDIITRLDDTNAKAAGAKKPDGTTKYQLEKNQVKDKTITPALLTTCFPAKVTGGGPGEGPYQLKVYMNGTSEKPTEVEEAYQLQIHEEEQVPEETWVIANRVVTQKKDSNGNDDTKVLWYFQVPVWL